MIQQISNNPSVINDNPEGYQITINGNQIIINVMNNAGAFMHFRHYVSCGMLTLAPLTKQLLRIIRALHIVEYYWIVRVTFSVNEIESPN